MDSDRWPERWSWLDAVGWFYSVPGRILRALHRFCHRWEPACPDCAANLAKADEWAWKCQKAEADWVLLYDDREEARHWYAQRQTVPPGTPVLGGPEEGVASWPVGDADLAVASDTLLTGQRSRLPQTKAVAPPPPVEPPVAVRFPKTEEDVRKLHSDCKAIAEDPKWRMSQDDYVKASLGAGVRVSCIDQWGKVIMANRTREGEA